MSPDVATPTQVQQAFEVILAGQADPRTACTYLGTERAGLLAELEDLDPPWTRTLRVVLDRDGTVLGAVAVDYDEETGRSWIQGPWTAHPQAWTTHAPALVRAAIDLTPDGVEQHELCAAPHHVAMAALAATLGWRATDVSIAYVARTDLGWPARPADVRRAQPEDAEALAALHESSFPDTYASARQLLQDEERSTVVIEREGSVVGYASGRLQPDGSGYLDYIAVGRAYRGLGLARGLLAAIGRDLLARAPQGDVNLTVVDSNRAAIALYEGFGFVRDAELVGYRSWDAPA